MTHRIFLSSVQKEFAETRAYLKKYIEGNAILRRFFQVFVFEVDVPAVDATTRQVFLQELSECDIYIGLIGNAYGSKGADGISPTEREFDEATRLNIQRLIFVHGTDDAGREPEERAFLNKISPDLIRKRYTTHEELLEEIYSSLDYILEQEQTYRVLPFDAAPCPDATIEDLSEEKISWFRDRAIRGRNWNVDPAADMTTVLTKLHLFSRNGQLLNSALLLFGKDPQEFFVTSEVKCMHYHGTEPAKPIPSYHIYHGTLFDMIDNAVDFVMSKIDRSVGTREAENVAPVVYEIPRAAVAEAIVNAVAHRNYTSAGSVQVMLFSDRLEVFSPGDLNPMITVEQLSEVHESFPVNPRIADPFFLAQYAEKAGSGTTDMIRLCREAGLPTPVYKPGHGVFSTIIYRRKKKIVQPKKLGNRLGIRRETILQIMSKSPEIKIKEIAIQIGISTTAVENNIAWLKKKKYLAREGTNRKGSWVVLRLGDTDEG